MPDRLFWLLVYWGICYGWMLQHYYRNIRQFGRMSVLKAIIILILCPFAPPLGLFFVIRALIKGHWKDN